MSHLLLWVLGVSGAIVAVLQIFTARRLDLRPLIVGILTMLALLGLLGIGWNASLALHALAQPPAPGTAHLLITRISAVVNGTVGLGVALLVVSGLGGIGILLRDLLSRSQKPEGAS